MSELPFSPLYSPFFILNGFGLLLYTYSGSSIVYEWFDYLLAMLSRVRLWFKGRSDCTELRCFRCLMIWVSFDLREYGSGLYSDLSCASSDLCR